MNRFFKVRYDNNEVKAWFVDQPGCGFEFLEENDDAWFDYSSRDKEIIKQLEEDIDLCILEGWVTEYRDEDYLFEKENEFVLWREWTMYNGNITWLNRTNDGTFAYIGNAENPIPVEPTEDNLNEISAVSFDKYGHEIENFTFQRKLEIAYEFGFLFVKAPFNIVG